MLTLGYIQDNSRLLHFVGIKLDIKEIRKGGEFFLFETVNFSEISLEEL